MGCIHDIKSKRGDKAAYLGFPKERLALALAAFSYGNQKDLVFHIGERIARQAGLFHACIPIPSAGCIRFLDF